MSFQAGNSTWWYVADLQTRGPEWSGVVPSSVVTGSHFASHGTARSFVVRTIELISERGPLVGRQTVRQQDPERAVPTTRVTKPRSHASPSFPRSWRRS